ncbi:hypothetical protein [Paraliomyxa miuraensis]|uniref:hypothetical protein n=1 Tax=Paraliomyxa miuraensis TaxID=376150 RepID=UPI002250E91F|nr:hypothetical protein [Paraliomyxa miuraensis]MCX4240946.1 hypothetical protein [Paraliomyxa miuraensis]
MSARLTILFSIAACTMGAALVVTMPGKEESEDATATASELRPVPGERSVRASSTVRRTPLARRRFAAFGRRAPATDDDDALVTQPPVEFDPTALDPEEERRRVRSEWQAQLDAHAHQPVDGSWAPKARASFDRDLRLLSTRVDARLLDTDCRTDSCTGTVEFGSFEDAVVGYETFLHEDYAVNCARGTILPEPEDRARPYVATFLFDCSAQ